MSIHRKAAGMLLVLVGALPASAQRGSRPTTTTDTAKRAAPGVSLDFQDQELRTVLDAIAAAGELNVSLSNIPSQRVTVHMGRPVNRAGMIDMLKQIAESNGLKVTQSEAMIQIAGPPPEPANRLTPAQQLAQQIAAQ